MNIYSDLAFFGIDIIGFGPYERKDSKSEKENVEMEHLGKIIKLYGLEMRRT